MMTFADAGRALGNGQIDALCQSSAPAAAVTELAETQGVTVLPYGGEQMTQITGAYPFYHSGTMPADMYQGVPATELPYTTVYWVAHERVPAETVQRILEYVYQPEVKQRLAEGHRAWAQMEPDVENFTKSRRAHAPRRRGLLQGAGPLAGRRQLSHLPAGSPLPVTRRPAFSA